MLALLAALTAQVSGLPEHPGFDFSGLPDAPATLHAQTCGVTIYVTEDYADVTSTTVYKNPGAAGNVNITIPRRRYGDERSSNTNFSIETTWDKKAATYLMRPTAPGERQSGDVFLYRHDIHALVQTAKGGTHVLRIHYRVPVGKCGFDRKQNIVGYLLSGSQPIDGLNVAYQYGGHTVFRLPEVHPDDFEWQVGNKGAFIRKPNWTPGGQLTFLTFYPGGFKNIGG